MQLSSLQFSFEQADEMEINLNHIFSTSGFKFLFFIFFLQMYIQFLSWSTNARKILQKLIVCHKTLQTNQKLVM